MKIKTERDIKLLYGFHLFNNIAISVVANFLFIDKVFLRLGLDFSALGLIKGIGFLLPMIVNLLVSPLVQRWNRDREIIAAGYLFRVFLPLVLLLVPRLTLSGKALVALISVIMAIIHTFPIIANNSIQHLIYHVIPEKSLGRHLTLINVVWTLPGFLLAIPLSCYIDGFSAASDAEFYRAVAVCMLSTGVVQIFASMLILFLPRPPSPAAERVSVFKRITAPFLDKEFRIIMSVTVCFGVLSSMITSFVNPYLLLVQGLKLSQISALSAAVSLMSIFVMPLWGRALDGIGGRNSYKVALVGFILGIFALLGYGWLPVIFFAVFAWDGQRGCFGSGIMVSQQYLVLINSRAEYRPVYFAAATFMMGIGWFIGSGVGGFLLDLLQSGKFGALSLMNAYRVLFGIVIGLCFFLAIMINKIPKDRDNLSGKSFFIHLYRSIRGGAGRIQ